MTRLLSVENLDAGYDGTAVARDVSLHVDAGEVVAVLGPNGAGKTTTLLTVAGTLKPLSGSITFGGDEIGGRKPFEISRRGLSLVPEGRSIFTTLTTEENLRLGARTAGSIEAAYETFPALRELADRRAGLLSGGEQQMLVVGRALLGDPELLVVDELSLGLAPIIVEKMLPVLRSVTAEMGKGLLLVEQHVDLALEIADRVYVLAHGHVVLDESAAWVRGNRDRLTEAYLGATSRNPTESQGENTK